MNITPPVRGQDAHGSGRFGDPRGDHKHRGIDYACFKGSMVKSVCAGKVTKIGFPYSQGSPDESWDWEKRDKFLRKKALRYVQVTDKDGRDHRFFYVVPYVTVGDSVDESTIIGETQGLADIYPGITDHFHYEIKVGGKIINPNSSR